MIGIEKSFDMENYAWNQLDSDRVYKEHRNKIYTVKGRENFF